MLFNRVGIALTALVVFASLSTQASSTGVSAASLTVTRFDDPVPEGCAADDCSLREAIIAANTTAGSDSISLVRGTYSVSIHGRYEDASLEGDLDVTDDVTIAGSGPEETVILMNSPPLEDRVFDVMPHVSLQLAGLAVRDVFFNLAPLDCGGGIRNRGDLTLSDVVIADNVMRGDGGGICNEGNLSITDSLISGNCACFAGYGGGLYSAGPAEVVNTQVSGNRAHLLHGGGIHANNIRIANSAITNNALDPGDGGGGVSIDGNGSIVNTTISHNRSRSEFFLALGLGGGLFVSGSVALRNVTLVENRGDGGGGGIYSCRGQPCRGEIPALVALSNTIVANNAADECSGPVTSAGHNLSSDGTCGLTGAGDLPNTNLLLGPLADNGGPTQTRALPPGSPAVDAGDNQACLGEDQRGVSRPFDGNGDGVVICDIGAYELHYCLADVNDDAVVDVVDLKIVASAMGSRQGTRRWNVAADLVPDGVINVQDLRVVLRERGARDCD